MTPPTPNYVHRARLARADEVPPGAVPVHDGDTFYLRLDLGTYAGARIDPVIRIRLAGIDAVELSSPLGPAARKRTLDLLSGSGSAFDPRLTVATEKPDSAARLGETLGRTVARVWVDGDDLADVLRNDGFEKGNPDPPPPA